MGYSPSLHTLPTLGPSFPSLHGWEGDKGSPCLRSPCCCPPPSNESPLLSNSVTEFQGILLPPRVPQLLFLSLWPSGGLEKD